MGLFTGKRAGIGLIVPMLIAGMLFMAACTGAGTQNLQGILQNINSINGTITLQTQDGQTHVITIDSKTQFTVDGQTIALEALDPGTEIEIELKDDNRSAAGAVNARLARVSGTIAQFQSGQLSITPQSGGTPVTVSVNSTTQIKLEDDKTGTTADLGAGARVEVKYDPQTRVALKVHVNSGEEANIEGTVTGVSDNRVTVEDKKGRALTFKVDNTTRIENGTIADITVGDKVEARFDPVTLLADRITLQGKDESRGNGNREEGNRGQSENRTSGQGTETPTAIPHTLVGRENCLLCHAANGIKPFPANHAGRTNDVCTTCHQTSAG